MNRVMGISRMKIFHLLALLLISHQVLATEGLSAPLVEPAHIQDGVFALSNGYQKTIVELNSGRFRYWNFSDVKISDDVKYPVIGKYIVSGNSVILQSDKISPLHARWTFRKINNATAVWADFAEDTYLKNKQLHSYGILWLTNKTAEKIAQEPQR